MLKKWFSSNKDTPESLPWDEGATQALQSAVQQAPIPSVLRSRMRKELAKAAEEAARQAGHDKVTPEDLIAGLMAKIPKNMRGQVQKMLDEKLKKAGNQN